MDQFFAKDFAGQAFELFSVSHLIAIGCILLCLALIFIFRRRMSERFKLAFRWTLAIVLLINEIGWHIWNAAFGQWNLETMLPFHLCSILIWLSAFMLIKKNTYIYEFAYLLGIMGALQAILTPDLGAYSYPHYRFFQTFLSHGGIIIATLYMTWVEGFRPIPASVRRVIIGTNIYAALVGLVNWLVGGNYLYIAHKPPTASLLDMLPEWPVYLIILEGLVLIVIVLMYVPFALHDKRVKKQLITIQS
jgi:hypothetical integral membrane protein (TIGR02206 family)